VVRAKGTFSAAKNALPYEGKRPQASSVLANVFVQNEEAQGYVKAGRKREQNARQCFCVLLREILHAKPAIFLF